MDSFSFNVDLLNFGGTVEVGITSRRSNARRWYMEVDESTEVAGMFQRRIVRPSQSGPSPLGSIYFYAPRLELPRPLIVHEVVHAVTWGFSEQDDLMYSWFVPEREGYEEAFLKEEPFARHVEFLYGAIVERIIQDGRIILRSHP